MLFSERNSLDDQEFIESIYQEYVRLLYQIARQYIFEADLVEDIVHDAFEKLIPKVSLLRSFDCCRLRAYLVSTVRNTAITKAKKLKEEHARQVSSDFEDAIGQIPDAYISMEENLLSRERREAFLAAFKSLGQDEQFLLEAKYFLQRSDKEIAEELHVKPSSIRMMLTRVRRKMLTILSKEDNIDGQDKDAIAGKL